MSGDYDLKRATESVGALLNVLDDNIEILNKVEVIRAVGSIYHKYLFNLDKEGFKFSDKMWGYIKDARKEWIMEHQ